MFPNFSYMIWTIFKNEMVMLHIFILMVHHLLEELGPGLDIPLLVKKRLVTFFCLVCFWKAKPPWKVIIMFQTQTLTTPFVCILCCPPAQPNIKNLIWHHGNSSFHGLCRGARDSSWPWMIAIMLKMSSSLVLKHWALWIGQGRPFAPNLVHNSQSYFYKMDNFG